MRAAAATRPVAPPTSCEVALPGGRLTVNVRRAEQPLETLCSFAARANPKRPHLIVSRVLGRHLPARPSAMRAASDALAAKLPDDLPGPVLLIGLAETAVCLGQSVHEAYVRRWGRRDVVFLPSTRQRADDRTLLVRFEEAHSHAPAHLLYAPDHPAARALASEARSLVLVDDELSTGATFVRLTQALTAAAPRLERLVALTLTDWSDSLWLREVAIAAESGSLLQGTLEWRGDGASPPPVLTATAGRLGHAPGAPRWGEGRADVLSEEAITPVLERLDPLPHALTVLGDGEFTYPPFRLAERLERAGHDVRMQAVSRSPVLPGGPIDSVQTLSDSYSSGAPMYLYGRRRTGAVLFCHETPPEALDQAFLQRIGARSVDFGSAA